MVGKDKVDNKNYRIVKKSKNEKVEISFKYKI